MSTTTSQTAAVAIPAVAAVSRLLPRHAQQIDIDICASHGPDWFNVSGPAGAVRIEATSPATALTGLGWYLKYRAGVDPGWPGDSLSRLPAVLPAANPALVHTAVVPHRFAANDTNDSYDGPIRPWADYEREIDLLAVHGFNAVLVTIGTDAVYYRALQEFGYTEAELRAWIPRPAIQPWWVLQNTAALDGSMSAALLADRAALAARIVARLRELGMRPVLPGFFGTVPPGFAERNPGARIVDQGLWCGVPRPDWLDPCSPVFSQLAEAYYRHQLELLGPADDFKMDPLHEGGCARQVSVAEAAQAIFHAMDAAHPCARWLMIGWEGNPRAELLSQLSPERLLILDANSDRDADGIATQWPGMPRAFGSITNFGGRSTLGANAETWVERFRPSADDAELAGIAWMPESLGRDAAGIELFAELAWRDRPIDLDRWFVEYAGRRYGPTGGHGEAAWRILRQTAYATPPGTGSSPHDGLFTARPDLAATHTSQWSSGILRYKTALFAAALDELLAYPADTDAYRYDVVEVARQVLSNASRTLLPRMRDAHDVGDVTRFGMLRDTWLSWLSLLNRLLSTSRAHLLGPILASSRAAAHDDDEADALERDVCVLLTSWGTRPASEGGLHDYANRELAGLVDDVYRERWRLYLDSMMQALIDGTDPKPIDWYAFDAEWAATRHTYPCEPTGDPIAIAHEVRSCLAADPYLIDATVTARVTPQGLSVQTTVRNDNGFADVNELEVALSSPTREIRSDMGTVSAEQVPPSASVGGTWLLAENDLTASCPVDRIEIRYRWRSRPVAVEIPIRIG